MLLLLSRFSHVQLCATPYRIEKQGRKGIIITMGDEPLNPYLPVKDLNEAANCTEQADIETDKLYKEASKKFDMAQ